MSDQPSVIHWFDDFGGPNPHGFLSNFFVGEPIQIYGNEFQTGEHLFQAMKADDASNFRTVMRAKDPHEAKRYGRTIRLREDWEQIKYDVMAFVLRRKFTMERAEGQMLLDTGDSLLIEGTYWGDDVWGVCLTRKDPPWLTAPGRNWLGTLLMARRAELRSEVDYPAGLGVYNYLFAEHKAWGGGLNG